VSWERYAVGAAEAPVGTIGHVVPNRTLLLITNIVASALRCIQHVTMRPIVAANTALLLIPNIPPSALRCIWQKSPSARRSLP
jgi:hypothetical protein